MFEIRTDLAVEENERIQEEGLPGEGISVLEETADGDRIAVTTVRIETAKAANIMGKPQGNYITIEAPGMTEESEDIHRGVSEQLGTVLAKLIHADPEKQKTPSFLVAGLGNRSVTPDALGPLAVDNLRITRHLIAEGAKKREASSGAERDPEVPCVSAIAPGVMAQTGMETCEILSGIIRQTRPDYLLVIDALAARNARRLCKTVQITDTGIWPGSGVGNHRHAITKETTGIPVIAIGIPTVIEAGLIMQDTEQMFVTSKDIDAQIKQMSYTVSEGIHAALWRI